VIIDPRKSELARVAAVHLQPKPGEDPTILAGMLRIILDEGLGDREFLARNARGHETLRRAIETFTPEYVERRADVRAADLLRAARLYASSKNGGANAGTGPNMAPRGALTEYLLLALKTVCGHYKRAGERISNPNVFQPRARAKAQPSNPTPGWGFGEKIRVRNLTNTASGLPTAALADEILLPGDGQVRVLISVGGNPMAAWPDQRKTYEAMKALELNITLDIKMSATAKVADYVIAPKLSLEVPSITLPTESLTPYAMGYPAPYGQYTPAIVAPPPGSDLIEEWEFFYGLAQRMKLPLSLAAAYEWGPEVSDPIRTELDLAKKPTTDEILEILAKGSRIPIEEVKRHPEGKIFDDPTAVVEPGDPACTARLELADPTMMGELAEVAGEPIERDAEYPFRLVSRRLPDVHNSAGRDIAKLVRKYNYNPAFMNPFDLEKLGLAKGDLVEISSDHDTILGVVEPEAEIRRGVVSMPHCFGDLPTPENDLKTREIGSNTGRLSSVERDYDPYTGIPRMSAIPVQVTRA
jgi:anaerobic selenocysteine-containing dehydrogenase